MTTMATAKDKLIAAPVPVRASGSHFYRYSEFTPEKEGWLKEIVLEHRLYVPTLPQLNDPADGRPRFEGLSEEELYSFLYCGPYGVLARNRH